MKIRTATISDLPQLTQLFDAYRVFYKKEPNLEQATIFLKERMENKESVVYVAESEKGNLVGFVQLYPLFSSTQMKRMWLLNDLFVAPKSRGGGVSVLLINEAKKLAKNTNATGLLLETAKDNVIGNQLYPKTGFEVDENHFYYFWVND